jgi:hypothetical protein
MNKNIHHVARVQFPRDDGVVFMELAICEKDNCMA